MQQQTKEDYVKGEDKNKKHKDNIRNWKKSKKIEIGYTAFDITALRSKLADESVTAFKCFFSARTEGNKKDVPHILIQLTKSNGILPEYEYLEGTEESICPPPTGTCDTFVIES